MVNDLALYTITYTSEILHGIGLGEVLLTKKPR